MEQQVWYPSEEFYLKNGRAACIRQICLAIVEQIDAILHRCSDQVERQKRYGDLERLNGELRELGIVAQMHVEDQLPLEAFQVSPVLAAEWLAGQIVPLLGKQLPIEATAVVVLSDFTQQPLSQLSLFESEGQPALVLDFRVVRSMLNFAKKCFDAI